MVPLTILEDWLRRNGLPHMVPGRRRLRGVIPRTTAILVSLLTVGIASLWAEAALTTDHPIPLEELLEHPRVIIAAAGVMGLLLLAIPFGIVTARLQRRLPLAGRLIVDVVVWALWLVGLAVITKLLVPAGELKLTLAPSEADLPFEITQGLRLHWTFLERLELLAVAFALAWLDFGVVIAWTTKRALREITRALPAVARTLPLLLLTVLLVFFTNELWQISAAISKPRMTALGLFLIGLAFLVVLPSSIDMVDDEATDEEHAPLLERTPFAGIPPTHEKLHIAERINLVMVAVAVQAIQITVFVLATFAVFAIVGSITLTPELIREWSGRESQPLTMLGIEVGLDRAMFRVCLILALFSGVSFAASTLIDDLYRRLFLSRVAREVRRSIAARHRYRTALASQDRGFRWRSLVMPPTPRRRR